MCNHEEVLDSGEYICIKCGIVLDQEYVYEEGFSNHQITDNDRHSLDSNISTILDHLNLNNLDFDREIHDLIDEYLSNLKCKVELKIGACIYYLLSSKSIPCQLNRISGLVCSNTNDNKKLFKLIQIFPQQNISFNDPSKLAEFLLSHTDFDKVDKNRILQLINLYFCKFCSYSPITQIAGISYLYFKVKTIQKRSLKIICDNFLTSQNSVYLYLNHSCTKNWNLK